MKAIHKEIFKKLKISKFLQAPEKTASNRTINDFSQSPLESPIELSITTEDVTESLEKDVVTGAPIQNPNGERIQIEVPRSFPVIEFSRYENYPDNPAGVAAIAAKIALYANKINADTFLGFPPGSCFMHAPHATREAINGGYYFKMTYRITIHGGLEPYKARPLCEGYTFRGLVGGNIRSTALYNAGKYSSRGNRIFRRNDTFPS